MNDLGGERYRVNCVFRLWLEKAAVSYFLTSCLPKKLYSNRVSAPAHVPRFPMKVTKLPAVHGGIMRCFSK
jgi:hypothetical protein